MTEEKNDSKEMIRPYSHHTFSFPFVWNAEKNDITYARLVKIFRDDWRWADSDIKYPLQYDRNDEAEKARAKDKYAEYAFFHPGARDAIFGGASNIVANFDYKLLTGATYSIHKKLGDKGAVSRTADYTLPLCKIHLSLFTTGVGILSFVLENYSYKSIDDVKTINEFGRRLSLPIVRGGEGDPLLTADRLTVCLGKDTKELTVDFDGLSRMEQAGSAAVMENPTYIASFVTEILSGDPWGYVFTSDRRDLEKKKKKTKYLYVYPAIDDRMFVSCLVRDGECAKKAANVSETVDEEGRASLYELFYIDPAGDCSCHNREMLDGELEASLYRRWQDRGTVYGVTHHSLVCVTTEEAPVYVIHSFNTIYIDIALLCLAQRASLIAMQAKASELTRGIDERRRGFSSKQIPRLMDLQECFVAFKNRLDLFTVSAQYQGEELYEMLREAMYVKANTENMEHQLDELYEATNVNNDFRFNKWAMALSFSALFLTLGDVFNVAKGTVAPTLVQLLPCGVALLLAIAAFAVSFKWFSRK